MNGLVDFLNSADRHGIAIENSRSIAEESVHSARQRADCDNKVTNA
jgi:hypothetical protein